MPAATEPEIVLGAHAAGREDACMLDLLLPLLRNLPKVVMRKHQCVVLCLPPLNLALNMEHPPDAPFDGVGSRCAAVVAEAATRGREWHGGDDTWVGVVVYVVAALMIVGLEC